MATSLVEQLQADALDKNVDVAELLRKALVAATKLQLQEFEEWILRELDGYKTGDPTPEYRNIQGQVVAWNPYHGWIPIHFAESELASKLSHRPTQQPVAELERMLEKRPKSGVFQMPFSHDVQRDLSRLMNGGYNPTVHVPVPFVQRIVDTVRNVILKWTLKLEKDGITGKGLSFSVKEKKKAADAHYHVINFLGPVSNSQVQQGTAGSNQSMEPAE